MGASDFCVGRVRNRNVRLTSFRRHIGYVPTKTGQSQAVDYYLWALQRFYERREDRYLELIWPHVGEIHDWDRVAEGRRGVIYTKQKPLTLAAFEK